jgi:hypothetical protein
MSNISKTMEMRRIGAKEREWCSRWRELILNFAESVASLLNEKSVCKIYSLRHVPEFDDLRTIRLEFATFCNRHEATGEGRKRHFAGWRARAPCNPVFRTLFAAFVKAMLGVPVSAEGGFGGFHPFEDEGVVKVGHPSLGEDDTFFLGGIGSS